MARVTRRSQHAPCSSRSSRRSIPSSELRADTLQALARQVPLDAGHGRDIVADRLPLLRAARRRVVAETPTLTHLEPSQLDTSLSAYKIEGRAPPEEARPV